jgi:transposase
LAPAKPSVGPPRQARRPNRLEGRHTRRCYPPLSAPPRGITHTIPERADQQKHRRNRGRRGGRPPIFNKLIYRHRNVVERCFNRIKQCRSVATCYDKTSSSFQATVTIAALLQWP